MPSSAGSSTNMSPEDQRLLNAYIFDYLVKQSYRDTARAFQKETDIPTISDEEAKRRADASDPPNSTLGGALDSNLKRQGKEARTNGVDRPSSSSPNPESPKLVNADIDINVEGGFLAEWWTIFWDMFAARQGRPSSIPAASFMAHNQVCSRLVKLEFR